MRYLCTTLFDITATGVTGHYNASRGGFSDRSGKYIDTAEDWNRSRNQQRNWETLMQLISLRTQVVEHTYPIKSGNRWQFEFTVETAAVFHDGTDPVGVLLSDSAGVPMMTNLENSNPVAGIITVIGPDQNIWFSVIE